MGGTPWRLADHIYGSRPMNRKTKGLIAKPPRGQAPWTPKRVKGRKGERAKGNQGALARGAIGLHNFFFGLKREAGLIFAQHAALSSKFSNILLQRILARWAFIRPPPPLLSRSRRVLALALHSALFSGFRILSQRGADSAACMPARMKPPITITETNNLFILEPPFEK